MDHNILDVFGPVEDTTTDIIKVVGVGGGGCNAVGNMYREGMQSVTFAVCNTDSKSLSVNPVPTKIMLGKSGHGAGADPKKGREEAELNIEELKTLFSDHTQMAFIVCAMGGGTGTGAGPLVAGIAKELGLLTIGIVTLPFYFEKRPKIIKALKGLDEMRANVDALLIINNEQISKVFSDSHIPVNEALRRADAVMANAVRSISELITLNGKIQTDFSDVKTTMKNAVLLGLGRFPRTLGMAAIWAVPVLLLLFTTALVPLVLMFGLSFPGLVMAYLYSPVFKKFEPEVEEVSDENFDEDSAEKDDAYRSLAQMQEENRRIEQELEKKDQEKAEKV